MKRLLYLILPFFLITNCFAQSRTSTYPPQGLISFQGLDDTSTPSNVKDGRASDLSNVILGNTGKLRKRNGYSVKVGTLDTNDVDDTFEAVTGLWELYKSNGNKYFIATCADKLFYANSTAWNDNTGSAVITEGQNNQFSFATALDYAIGTNGVNPPIRCDGVNPASAVLFSGGTFNLTSAKCVSWWKNYLIFGNTVEGGVAHTTRIRWSNVGTIDTWSDDDFVDIATLGGQQIEGFGILYDNLFIFLTDSIYKVSLVGGDELINVAKVSEGVGCIAKNSIQNVQIGNSEGLIFLSRDKTINFCNGVNVVEISTLIEGVMDDTSATRLPYAVSANDKSTAHYYLALDLAPAGTNDVLLDLHYGIGEWSKHSQIDANAMCYADDSNSIPRIYFGNYKAFVYQMQDDNLDSDVAGEVGIFDTLDISDTATASGLQVLYDTSADLSDTTGAIVRITAGTGVGEEQVIASCTATGIIVTNAFTTTPDTTSQYSIGDIDAYYVSKWFDLGSPSMRKNFLDLFVWKRSTTSSTMNTYYGNDFSETIQSTDIVSSVSGSLWGTAIWGTGTWSGDITELIDIKLGGSGRFAQIKFAEPSIDETFDLDGYCILYEPLDVY